MAFPTDWDIEYYRNNYEADEHWELKKQFMEVYKDEFPEDELVSLAQTFLNIELLGCIYPKETMAKMAELSGDLAKSFRSARKNRIKRTFVDASKAANDKVLKNKSPNTENDKEKPNLKRKSNEFEDEMKRVKLTENEEQNYDIFETKFGKILLYDSNQGDNNILEMIKHKFSVPVTDKYSQNPDQTWKCEIFVDNELTGIGEAAKKNQTKAIAVKDAVCKLKQVCYTIKLKTRFVSQDNLTISKKGKGKTEPQQFDNKKLDENNLGFRLLKSLGWKGNSLNNKSGLVDPIGLTVTIGRSGLGSTLDFDINHYEKLLKRYSDTSDLFDLVFTSEFTNGERAKIHVLARKFNLKAKSFNNENKGRQLVVSKKITLFDIALDLINNKDPALIQKYELIHPTNSNENAAL